MRAGGDSSIMVTLETKPMVALLQLYFRVCHLVMWL